MLGLEYIFEITLQHYIALGLIIFFIGFLTAITKDGIMMFLMGLEVCLVGICLLFVAFSKYLNEMTGVLFLFFTLLLALITLSAAAILLISIVRKSRLHRRNLSVK